MAESKRFSHKPFGTLHYYIEPQKVENSIAVGCNWSYVSQDKRKAANVAKSEDWVKDLLNHDCKFEGSRTVC